MSGFEAIAGVSTTLRTLLLDQMVTGADVTIAPPDVTVAGMDGQRANLYLFHVRENGHLKNQEIPGQGHPGTYGHPPLSLDLDYLVTAYGASADGPDADLQAQQVLGDVMRVFHDNPFVADTLLDPSLLGEFERIKITLQPSSIDDLSKLWTALPETAFRRSITYAVSVIQIESRRPRTTPSPVRRREVYAFPLQSPYVEQVFREPPFALVPAPSFENARSPIVEVGDTLVILGRNLAGLGTSVRIGEVTVAVPAPRARRIEIAVPVAVTAGTHRLQVIQDLPLAAESGQPPVLHRGFASNVVPLLVLPSFAGINPAAAAAGDLVIVTVDPPVAAAQARTLLLDDHEIRGEPVAAGSPPSADVDFRLPTGAAALAPGSYLVRVRVDGAESRLTINAVTGAYDGPTFTVTP